MAKQNMIVQLAPPTPVGKRKEKHKRVVRNPDNKRTKCALCGKNTTVGRARKEHGPKAPNCIAQRTIQMMHNSDMRMAGCFSHVLGHAGLTRPALFASYDWESVKKIVQYEDDSIAQSWDQEKDWSLRVEMITPAWAYECALNLSSDKSEHIFRRVFKPHEMQWSSRFGVGIIRKQQQHGIYGTRRQSDPADTVRVASLPLNLRVMILRSAAASPLLRELLIQDFEEALKLIRLQLLDSGRLRKARKARKVQA